MKLKKTILKREFYFRAHELESNSEDVIFEMVQGKPRQFTTDEYKGELSKFTDPTNQAALKAFTKRSDLF